jgi:hypothetical protein
MKLSFTDADTFEPKEISTAPSVGANKWEGEDEDEDVKVRGSKMIIPECAFYLLLMPWIKDNHVNTDRKVVDL